MDFYRFYQHPLGVRLLILILLIFVVLRYTKRGMHYGLLMGLISGINQVKLFENEFGLPSISLDRIVWPIVYLFFIWKWYRGETERRPFDWTEYSILVFFAVIGLSLFQHRANFLSTEFFYSLRGLIIPCTAYFIARRSIGTDRQMHAFLVGVGFTTLYFIITSFGEIWHLPALVFPEYILDPSAGTHYGRARGLFLNASFLGLAIAMSLPIFIWLFFTDQGRRCWLWAALGFLSIIPLAYTIQRAAWLCASAALAITSLAWPRKRIALMSLLVVSLTIMSFIASGSLVDRIKYKIQDDEAIDFRVGIIYRSIVMIRQHPLIGVGFDQFRKELPNYTSVKAAWSRRDYVSHNTLLTLWAELGLVGFVPYLAIFVSLIFKTVKLYLRHARFRAIIGVLWAITLALLIMMVSVEMRGQLYHYTLFFVMWGAGLEAIRRRYIEPSRKYPYRMQLIPFPREDGRLSDAQRVLMERDIK